MTLVGELLVASFLVVVVGAVVAMVGAYRFRRTIRAAKQEFEMAKVLRALSEPERRMALDRRMRRHDRRITSRRDK